MMTQKKTTGAGMIKYLLILPLASALIVSSNAENLMSSVKQSATIQTQSPPPATLAEEEDDVFMVVEKMPVFPGGDGEMFTYLSTNIRYPAEAREAKIEGRVICSFVVETDGSIKEIEVVRGVAPSLDEEAVRVISLMPNWTPGEQRGQKVRVKYTLPMNFRLETQKKTATTDINTNPPVIVVDGEIKPVDFNLSSVNPSDIDKLDVIKTNEKNKAQIQAKYGERGVSNGVIIITTKK